MSSVRIQAAAVNLLDSKIRDGEFKLLLPYRPPFVLGHDLAGTVVRRRSNAYRTHVATCRSKSAVRCAFESSLPSGLHR
jgi:NADPH:quinone reductase-like Zn-dependent oxidoreductase